MRGYRRPTRLPDSLLRSSPTAIFETFRSLFLSRRSFPHGAENRPPSGNSDHRIQPISTQVEGASKRRYQGNDRTLNTEPSMWWREDADTGLGTICVDFSSRGRSTHGSACGSPVRRIWPALWPSSSEPSLAGVQWRSTAPSGAVAGRGAPVRS